MLKKRVIFTLLFADDYFVLSRNFRHQKVGDLNWLNQHYNFSQIAYHIDELIVLDVSKNERNSERFCQTLSELTRECFVPVAAGGGINNIEKARSLLRSGADKIVINTALFEKQSLVHDLANEFGQQCVVGSVDIKKGNANQYEIYVENGTRKIERNTKEVFANLPTSSIAELYLNSIDQDGTGNGYNFELLDLLAHNWKAPIILAGGVGNSDHLLAGIKNSVVDAVATANLLNFVGDGLAKAREALLKNDINLAQWPSYESFSIRNEERNGNID